MSVAASDGPPARSRLHGLRMWLGHYTVYIGSAVGVVAMAALATTETMSSHSVVPRFANVVILAFWTAAYVGQQSNSQYHASNICPRELAAAPLDNPDRAVDRARPQLKRAHWLHDHFWAVVVFGVLMVGMFSILPFVQVNAPWSYTPIGVLFAGLITADRISLIHQRLQPWCPFCRDNGGGEFSTDPSPTPHHTHVRV
jgi:hypothetical protein